MSNPLSTASLAAFAFMLPRTRGGKPPADRRPSKCEDQQRALAKTRPTGRRGVRWAGHPHATPPPKTKYHLATGASYVAIVATAALATGAAAHPDLNKTIV